MRFFYDYAYGSTLTDALRPLPSGGAFFVLGLLAANLLRDWSPFSSPARPCRPPGEAAPLLGPLFEAVAGFSAPLLHPRGGAATTGNNRTGLPVSSLSPLRRPGASSASASASPPPPEPEPWYVAFAARQHAIADGRVPDGHVVLFSGPTGGFGNRLYGFLAAFTFALLDDRLFVADWPSLSDGFEAPLLGDTWLRSRQAALADATPRHKVSEIDQCYFADKCGLCRWVASGPFSGLPEVRASKVVELQTNCPVVKAITAHPENRAKLAQLGLLRGYLAAPHGTPDSDRVPADSPRASPARVAFHVMHRVLADLFPVAAPLRPAFEGYLARLRPEPDTYYVVGFQVRQGGDTHEVFLYKEDVALMWECAEGLARARGVTDPSKVRWFVAADQAWVKEEAVAKFGDRVVVSDEHVAHLERGAYSPSTFHGIAMDTALLAACDDLVTTAGSTFGAVSAIRGGLLPYYVRGGAAQRGEKCKLVDLDDPPPAGGTKPLVAAFRRRALRQQRRREVTAAAPGGEAAEGDVDRGGQPEGQGRGGRIGALDALPRVLGGDAALPQR